MHTPSLIPAPNEKTKEYLHVSLQNYKQKQQTFWEGLTPEQAVQLPIYTVLDALSARFGFAQVQAALMAEISVPGPKSSEPTGNWLKSTRMVGINVRTVGNFFNVVKYSLTLPSFHDSIHLLPIWEPGVVGSLYGMASWNINPEFFSQELYELFPHLSTIEKQLKATINLLHLMGFSVGMDVIPHTDRFSEMVLAHPRYFEWVRQKDGVLLDHREGIWQEVEARIYQFLELHGTADGSDLLAKEQLFGNTLQAIDEAARMRLVFGRPDDYGGRQARRVALMRFVIAEGYETLPMTMAPPYRSLHINKDVFTLDEAGYAWYQYEFDEPQTMSRVFGPLTRYRLFESKNDNQEWGLDFEKPLTDVWSYVCQHYAECQQAYQFDFMRGDMTHVQMRPEGVPAILPDYYDILGSVKKYIVSQGVNHFAFFAESFVGAPDFMGYGDEIAHLEALGAEVTLGDLQSTTVGSALFMTRFRQYLDVGATRNFKPCFTVLTADKDDPRFDCFFQQGNIARYFTALFMKDLPSYVGAGFETRGLHLERAANEEYSKLYVFQIQDDKEPDKVTRGPYIWGDNSAQFEILNILRKWYETNATAIEQATIRWLTYPDPTQSTHYIAWQLGSYIFVVNLNGSAETRHVTLPHLANSSSLEMVLSTSTESETPVVKGNGLFFSLVPLQKEECRIYKCQE
ncbi:alpha-amylase family protein [Arundinibacter roseus]|uniref:Alpha-amylase n=1 Tax=Arundinibacter roseus TaxID=2070510 RepID=A0A4R4KCK0_9BACT|nr:hypothetical protein [Arundinibacter roseus]TDB64542.1 hypothetical protein EZE20_12770 [Arundinibacter roseus]